MNPDRAKMRPAGAGGFRQAWDILERGVGDGPTLEAAVADLRAALEVLIAEVGPANILAIIGMTTKVPRKLL